MESKLKNETKNCFKVDNAVILAAGISSDTMYSPPKGLYKVDGEPLIERQIRQLKEKGIDDISVVVGYKKEMYFYLEDKYGVKLVGNPRLDKNSVYSLYLVKEKLKIYNLLKSTIYESIYHHGSFITPFLF